QLMTEAELRELLSQPPAGTIALLRRHGAIKAEGQGLEQRFLVDSPALLRIAGRLEKAGIGFETTLRFHEILEKHLRRAADEVVEHALRHLGKGFGRSAEPKDNAEAVECLSPDSPGGNSTHVIFAREIQRAVSEHLKTDVCRR
ncbi:MAG TPA: hypothetical protein VGI70_14330, partial [Polyangiales bacterium]